jgi:hypothetical protein
MWLGELVNSDATVLQNFRKSIRRLSVKFSNDPCPHASFFLPTHKADRFYEGLSIVLEKYEGDLDTLQVFKNYITLCDSKFTHLPDLWLHESRKLPLCSWFIPQLRAVINDPNVAGHSLRSGGATALALAGMPLEHIRLIGRWSSEAFLIYLRQNPIWIQGTLAGRLAFDAQCVERLL